MYRIDVGQAPKKLEKTLLTALHTEAPLDYDTMDSELKNEIRKILFDAQRGRCAYCEERITLTPGRTKIEHFHPKTLKQPAGPACSDRTKSSSFSRIDVEWGNLLLCCKGDTGSGKESSHCDTRKDDTDICGEWHNPRHLPVGFISLVTVQPDGKFKPFNPPGDLAAAQNVLDEVLGLNRLFTIEGVDSSRSS